MRSIFRVKKIRVKNFQPTAMVVYDIRKIKKITLG